MIKIPTMKAAAMAAVLLSLAATLAHADECEGMEKAVQNLINSHDPAKEKGDPRLCAAFGYGLGLIKTRRMVADECMEDGDKRTEALAKLDRITRDIQSEVDKHCK